MKPKLKVFSNVNDAFGYRAETQATKTAPGRVIVDPLSSRFPALAAFEGIALELLEHDAKSPEQLAKRPRRLAS